MLTRDPQRARHLVSPQVKIVTGDVRDAATTAAAALGVDVVVSAVHGFNGTRGASPETVDRDGNEHLIEAARLAGADVVLMSVVGASTDSPFELFRMKAAAEAALAASGVPATIVRATAFRELWVDLLRQTAGRAGRPLVFGRGHNPINFVSVVDVAALVQRVVMDRSTREQTLEIAGPDDLTFDELARSVAAELGGGGAPRHVPRAALHIMTHTVGRVVPKVGRQARAALAMDSLDLTYHAGSAAESRFPDTPGVFLTKDHL